MSEFHLSFYLKKFKEKQVNPITNSGRNKNKNKNKQIRNKKKPLKPITISR